MQFRHPRAVALLFGGILIGMQAAFWLLPHRSFSENEKRVLAQRPAVSAAGLADGSLFTDIEQYLSDHFPGRDAWVGVNAYLEQVEGRGAVDSIVRGKDGWLFPAPLSDDRQTLQDNMQAITAFAQAQTVPVYLMAVPSAGAVVQDQLPALHLDYPDADMLEQARRIAGDSVHWLDVLGDFQSADDPDTLYYRTDHHWTTAGAYRAYRLLMQEQGESSVMEDTFEVEWAPDFYGTSYSKSGLWLTPPDEIALWSDPGLQAETTVYDGDGREPVVHEGMLFREYLEQADKYPVFLSGNHARVHIQTNADTDKRLLVVKDSYAHALAPFLAEEYSTIDLIDLRYFKRQTISDWLRENPADDILFVYGLSSLAEDKNLQWLA
ncbi:DHHW family protein [Agathobaculum sp. Marseille-P7918]|uniref:DHHW family protein n=1 Tax=Agathobaculum sp. Marseille-P7918 TaxID=2479843 RepID=UPI000F63DC14|nr:DHHW family protein [Agathobaculum sp. Marseille-P7918]